MVEGREGGGGDEGRSGDRALLGVRPDAHERLAARRERGLGGGCRCACGLFLRTWWREEWGRETKRNWRRESEEEAELNCRGAECEHI